LEGRLVVDELAALDALARGGVKLQRIVAVS